MRILILTQYYPPESGAPQNRLHELAVRMRRAGTDVEVLTAMPNYPRMEIHEGYKGKIFHKETIDGVPVFRSWIYTHKNPSILPRLLNYFSFVFSSFFVGITKLPKYDYLIFESPPLFLGMSARVLARAKGAHLIMNVSDLWPESAEKLGLVTNRTALNLAKRLEERLYRKSVIITGQTQGIVADISSRFPDKQVEWIPNGVDTSFYRREDIAPGMRATLGFEPDDFLVVYAGIVGHAQGLDVAVRAAELLRNEPSVHFLIVGAGPEKAKLEDLKQRSALNNLHFFDPVPKSEMPGLWRDADAALVPLRDLPLFEGAIPSKIFEAQAMEVPLLLGVQGEAHELFIERGGGGLAFYPEDAEGLARQTRKLAHDPALCARLGRAGKAFVSEHFDRDRIAEKLLGILKNHHLGKRKFD